MAADVQVCVCLVQSQSGIAFPFGIEVESALSGDVISVFHMDYGIQVIQLCGCGQAFCYICIKTLSVGFHYCFSRS